MNQENLNNNVAPEVPSQPEYTTPEVPVQPEYTMPEAPTQPEYVAPVGQSEPTYATPLETSTQESIDKVSNLNKEDAMEEALSHTNQYTPFEVQQEEVNQETSIMSSKKTLIFLGIIFAIMLLFIIFLPQISEFIGG